MNAGAKAATGNVLYFYIVISFDRIINDTVQKKEIRLFQNEI
jgi:hypothetical protein